MVGEWDGYTLVIVVTVNGIVIVINIGNPLGWLGKFARMVGGYGDVPMLVVRDDLRLEVVKDGWQVDITQETTDLFTSWC